jgi:phosphoglucosamine mutase
MSKQRLFGTDGVRGKANDTLTAELALRLGAAAAHWVHETRAVDLAIEKSGARPFVVIGRDTRISCDMLECALAAGITSMGVDVLSIGIVPTPAVSHAVTSAQAAAGIVISASHNPYPDNGIKFFGSNGSKLADQIEDEIEKILDNLDSTPRPENGEVGRITHSRQPVDCYIEHVISTVSDGEASPLSGYSLVLDCANGAAYEVAPKIFERLGASITVLHAEPNGVNINVECGSTKPESMARAVLESGANAGLALDGDADRVMLADELGQIVDGDRMMAIIGEYLHRNGRLPGDVVVATIMSNVGLEEALAANGVHLHRTDVGDRYVAEAMHALGASIGGEQSGHILLPYITPTGDGIVTGLQVLRVMHESGSPLSKLASVVRNCPQKLRSIQVKDRMGWKHDAEIQAAIASGMDRLGNSKWLSVRPSGTESLIRVMAQGTDAQIVDSVVDEICGLVNTKYGISEFS